MSIEVLGVKIDQITHTEALQKVGDFLLGEGQHTIFTPNPEMLVKAQKDEYFKKVLNSSSLNLCDGFGLWLGTHLSSRAQPRDLANGLRDSSTSVGMTTKIDRIAGTDFMLEICRIAAERGSSIYLLGSGSDEIVKKTAENLQKQFPNLKIVGYNKGPNVSETNCHSERSEESLSQSPNGQRSFASLKMTNGNDAVIEKINSSRAQVVFVAFGMGKQEKWIYENLAELPSVKIAMGVGGAFDYISGTVPRAPRLMRKIGLEWVYRLFRQPSRFFRIFNATAKFVWYIIFRSG